jgi:hypothetical protein
MDGRVRIPPRGASFVRGQFAEDVQEQARRARGFFIAARKAVVCPSEPMAIAKIEESRHWNERFK